MKYSYKSFYCEVIATIVKIEKRNRSRCIYKYRIPYDCELSKCNHLVRLGWYWTS